jgi:hypothetical protein
LPDFFHCAWYWEYVFFLLLKSFGKVENASGDRRNPKFLGVGFPRELVLSACTYSIIKNKKCFAVEVDVFLAYECCF